MTDRLQYLDAGRGLAALVVVEHHFMVFFGNEIMAQLEGAELILGVLERISELNGHAVMFFFFISGWSIFLSLKRIRKIDGGVPWLLYLKHRARRILPVYWLALLWSWLFAVSGGRINVDVSLNTFLGNLLFLQGTTRSALFPPFSGNGPLWSLPNEVWYYLALPAWHLVQGGYSQRMRAIELRILFGLSLSLTAILLNKLAPNFFFGIAALWSIWLTGYIFASCFGRQGFEIRAAMTLVFIVTSITFAARYVRSDTLLALRSGYIIATVVACCLCVTHLIDGKATIAFKATHWLVRPLTYVGLGSYMIYLLHYPVLLYLSRPGGANGLGLACIAMTVLVVVATPVELRLQRWINDRV
jgi:peptidoglycan/LPS O-acetylase OafA/YrhL